LYNTDLEFSIGVKVLRIQNPLSATKRFAFTKFTVDDLVNSFLIWVVFNCLSAHTVFYNTKLTLYPPLKNNCCVTAYSHSLRPYN